MIFMTVGGDLPFARLTKHFDAWCKAHPEVEAFAQIGKIQPSDTTPESVAWEEMIDAARYSEACAKAELVVAHAGMGSIITALSLGKPIVLMPRKAKLMEHRNDHQLATAEKFKDRPGIFVAWDENELDGAISEASNFGKSGSFQKLPRFAPSSFSDRIREIILSGT